MPAIKIPFFAGQSPLDIEVTSQLAADTGNAIVPALLVAHDSGTVWGVSPPDAVPLVLPPDHGINNTVLDTSPTPFVINDRSNTQVTVLSSMGGLTYNALGGPVGDVLIVAGGGDNIINLGQGTATVVADGNSTVSAVYGGDTVYATAGGNAQIAAGHGATVYLAGHDTVSYYGLGAQIFAQDGADITTLGYNLGTNGGYANPINQAGAGSTTISAIGDSTGVITGYSGTMVVDASAKGVNNPSHAGAVVIDPEASNIIVLAGAGRETLFGTGEAGGRASNRGSDVVQGGNGYFHGGSGNNMLETSAASGNATLVGGATGGNTDQLYAQASWDTMYAGTNTTIMDASGATHSDPQGLTPDQGNIGELICARDAAAVYIYGAAGGSNTIVSGSGNSTVTGGHGAETFSTPAFSGGGLQSHGAGANTYIDGNTFTGATGGHLTISDFVPGHDVFALNGAHTVSQAANASGTSVTLSDNTVITFLNLQLSADAYRQIFTDTGA